MRETRHLWIGNLAENTREEGIAQHFKRYGKIDKVRFLPKRSGDSGFCACVAFMDIRSAQKAKAAVNTLGDRELITDYFDPSARSAPATNDEGQRHVQVQQRSNSGRRYESHRDSGGGDERFSRDHQSSYDRNIQPSEACGADSYDSDRSRSRAEGSEKPKSRTSSSKYHDSSRKRRTDVVAKEKKKHKKKMEETKVKGVKLKQKHLKERGRSPTIKSKKGGQSSTASSPGSRKAPKVANSSSDDRSSSSGSGSRSTSGSRRSSSASSTSSTGSSNSSKTPTSNSQSNSESSYEVEEGPETRKLVAMCIRKLPVRPTVTSLRDGIFHEFKKYGKVKSVLIRGDGPERHALVLFRTAAEANKAVAHAKSKLLFGAAIEASIYEGEVSGQELEECGGIIDEFHPRASRTLFVGNLDKTVGYSDIQNIFVRFGEIVAIEIKKQHNIPQYAFLQYTDIVSVVRAITKMDGEKLGRNTLKLGFGKTVMSSCLWVDGVTDSFTENYLASCFQRYGQVKHVVIDRNRSQALVFYSQYDYAQIAMAKMRARKLNGSRLKMDYASNELIEIFLKHMQSSGQSIQGLENIRQLLQPPSSPTAAPAASSSSYNRSSLNQDSRGSYYDDRSQGAYSEDQYIGSEGSYRRNWRGRSRERYVYNIEQSSHSRQKRIYDDPYERSEYHRDQTWSHDGYEGNRRTSHYDQDYRQRDYDVRRDQRTYGRKTSRGNVTYDDAYHYRGARDRSRDDRDIERVPERDRVTDRYFSRSGHLSPSHPRYVSRRSRSLSPHPRETERYSIERSTGDPLYRRRGRSGSRSPDFHTESLRRRNSMESKSSSHSGTRYTSRTTGDVDMREYLDEDKLSVASLHGDERIVEYSEKAKKLRVRKRISTPDSPLHDAGTSPKHHLDYASGSEKDHSSQDRQTMVEAYNENVWGSESPAYSDNRSRSGTPTRDENQDLIGEVIIKQPSKSSSRGSEKVRAEIKPSSTSSRKEKGKPRDKDYRKGYAHSSDSAKPEKVKPARSSSLIQRVHSPSETERKSNLPYTKDFDYRKHAVVRSSKSSGDASAARHKSSKTMVSRLDDERARHTRTDFDDRMSNSPHSLSPSSEKSRHRAAGSSSLLKREFSPRPEEEEKTHPAKVRKNSDRSRQEAERQKFAKERNRSHARGREGEELRDIDERRSYPQKRRHSIEGKEDEAAVSAKRERKLSSSDYSRHKTSHHHHQPSQKHEAPMSIARQMFLEEEEGDSGTESPALTKPVPEEEIEEIVISKTEDKEDKTTISSAEHSPTREFANAALVAAQSLLPKRLPKVGPKTSEKDVPTIEKKMAKKDDGNLTELEKEKERLQQLLSKLDREKQLDVKEAEEVADVVLKELTEKVRSKILSSKPAKQSSEKSQSNETLVDDARDDNSNTETQRDEESEHGGYCADDVTFEEEIVVDTIEEVTEDEIIETEVEEVAVKEEEVEVEMEVHHENESLEIEDTSASVQEIPVPVVPVTKTEEYDHTQGYRKQMEARKKEMEKLEKRKEHDRKKLLKKQEKEKKKQIKRVQAMRGPSQSVISFVDETEDAAEGSAQAGELGMTAASDIESPSKVEGGERSVNTGESQVQEAKNDNATSLAREVGLSKKLDVKSNEEQNFQHQQVSLAKNDEANCREQLSNPDLERPWPPDKEKSSQSDSNEVKNSSALQGTEVLNAEQTETPNISDSDAMDSKIPKPNSNKNISPVTPGSSDTPMGLTPLNSGKEPSPKIAAVGVTPTSSLTSSVSLKSSLATPTTTPSQSTRTPNFTTPSPASTSSTSSSKSHQKQKQVKSTTVSQQQPRPVQQHHPSKRPSHHARSEHHSRSRGGHTSDHRKRANHQQAHRSSSSNNHGSKMRPEGMKKSIVPISRRPMATITVGLDASPSKPLGKSELEKLRIELESVRNQLDSGMSPSSLSPCSGDEGPCGKSPAQLLSPLSPVLKSPADLIPVRRIDGGSPALQSGVSPSSTPTLTNRLKLIGRVKKKTPSIIPEVKPEENNIPLVHQDRDVEFRQSRIFRSSIFDQDSERLSHVCRQLKDDNDVDEEQKLNLTTSVVPLFSGSKFLEPSSFPGTVFSASTVSIGQTVPSVAASVSQVPVVIASADASVATEQPQLSSISEPKNVLSLSSSELPATAERKQHDFAGKNCNTMTMRTLDSETSELVVLPESLRNPILPVSDNPTPSNKEPLESDSGPLTNEKQSSETCLDHPHSTAVNETVTSQILKERIEYKKGLGKNAENVSLGYHEPALDPLACHYEVTTESRPDRDPETSDKTGDTQSLHTSVVGASEPEVDTYLSEVVGDIDVFQGSCMEITQSPTDAETLVTKEHDIEQSQEVDTPYPDLHFDSINENVEMSKEDARGVKKDSAFEIPSAANHMETAVEQEMVEDMDVEKPAMKAEKSTPSSESSSKSVAKQPPSQDCKSSGDSVKTSESKTKLKLTEKTAKKTAEIAKDSKKSKNPGKHKPSQKESKLGSKDHSSKKEMAKKHRSDESKKQIDVQRSVETKETKIKSEFGKPAKLKSGAEKSSSKTHKDTTQNSTAQSSKQSNEIEMRKAIAAESTGIEKAVVQRGSKSAKPYEASDGKSFGEKKEHTNSESATPAKIKDKDLPTKEKKLHKEGKKEKKSSVDKKPTSDSKPDPKKIKKKTDKHADDRIPVSLSSQKAETEKSKDISPTEPSKDAEDITMSCEKTANQMKLTSNSSKNENKETEKSASIKKKKKKKHSSEKEESKSTTAGKKSAKNPEDASNILPESSRPTQETRKAAEKLKKSSKTSLEKQKCAETKTLDKDSSKGEQSLNKKDGSKNTAEKLSKKDPLKKVSKAHADLKPSHSFPGKSLQKKEDTLSMKEKKRLKSGKSSSMSPASRKQSRYSLIYTDSSSDDSDDISTPAVFAKLSANPAQDIKSMKKADVEKSTKNLIRSDNAEKGKSKWPDLDDGEETKRSSRRHWSPSSSSSMSDSAGPPPVVSSSLLVTETIKSETILPEGYSEHGFTDSSDDECNAEREIKTHLAKPSNSGQHKSVDKLEQKMKKKPGNQEPRKSPRKEKQKSSEQSKTASRRIMWNASDSDSSDGELVISMSSTDISDESDKDETVLKTSSSKLQKSDPRLEETGNASQDMLLGLYLTSSSEDEESPKCAKLDVAKQKVKEGSQKNKKYSTKEASKVGLSKQKSSKVAELGAKSNFNSDSSDQGEGVLEKMKKKSKVDKVSGKDKQKSTLEQQSSNVSRKSEDRSKSKELVTRKSEKAQELEDSGSEMDVAEQPESKHAQKSKDSADSGKKTSSSRSSSKSKGVSQFSKSSLEKTKSDSKAMKPSSKFHDKKDKFKAKSHSLDKVPSHSQRSKDATQKPVESKPLIEHSTQDKPRSSSKDRPKVEKDAAPNKPESSKDDQSESPGVSAKDQHSHRSKQQKQKSGSIAPGVNIGNELKTQMKETEAKHFKKSSKEGKKGEKKSLLSDQGKGLKPEKEKVKLSKSAETGKLEKHGKKKRKKTHKKETKDVQKADVRKQQSQEKKESEATSVQPPIKMNEKEQKALARSLFCSDSDDDDDDFEMVEDSPFQQSSCPVVHQSSKDFDYDGSSHREIKRESLLPDPDVSSKKKNDVPNSPQKGGKVDSVKQSNVLPKEVSGALRISEKRRESGDSFMTSSTTDESDVEQRMAVQSAISSLERDNDVEKGSVTEAAQNFFSENEPESKPERKSAIKPPTVKSEKLETDSKPFGASICLSPFKGSGVTKPKEKKKKPLKMKDAGVKEATTHPSSSVVPHSGYSRSKHGLHYGTKERQENMDKMKSVSHERDEEAVRSIMGILDESSDADSYFSDVRPEEGPVPSSSAIGGRTPETDRSHRKSRDSDVSSGFERPTQVDSRVDDAKSEEVCASVDAADVKPGDQSDVPEERTMAEENELAAAVSSIEGLFGDFGNKPSEYGDFTSSQSSSFSEHQSISDDPLKKKAEASSQHETLSQEEVEKSSEEAAFAASTLMAESSEEDGSFCGFQPTPTHGISSVSASREKVPESSLTAQSSLDTDLMSVRNESAAQPEHRPANTSASIIDSSGVASTSRKRHRPCKEKGPSGRSSSHDTDRSASETSISETEASAQEAVEAPGQKPAKQRKISKSTSSSAQQRIKSDQYEFDSDANSKLSLTKPEIAAGNLPFVCATSSPQPQVQHSSVSVATTATPFVEFTSATVPVVAAPAMGSELGSMPIQSTQATPPQQLRRTSRDSDSGNATGATAKRRPSSSSSSSTAATSPTRGSLISQLTPAAVNSISGGMQMHGSSVYGSHNTPFLPPQSSAMPVQHNVPSDHSGTREFSVPHTVTNSAVTTFTLPTNSHLSQSNPFITQTTSYQHHHQGYHPHMPQQVRTMFSARPAHPTGPSHPSLYGQQPALGAANVPSMPGHTNLKLHSQSTGSQSALKSNMPPVMTVQSATTSFPTSVSASLTSPSQRQGQFVHHQPSGNASKPMDAGQSMQYHVGVLPYPHHTTTHQPAAVTTQPSPQQTPTPQESVAAHHESTQKSLPRQQVFSHPPGFPTAHPSHYQPHIYSVPSQISPQALGQPPFALPSPTRPPSSSQISPTVTAAPAPHDKMSAGIQRPPTNAFMQQQISQTQPIQQVPAASPQMKPAEVQHNMSQGQLPQPEPQPSQPSAAVSNPSQVVPPQSMYRKLDPAQPHLPGSQSGLAQFSHPSLYYPPASFLPTFHHSLPYMPQSLVLRPGMPLPATVVHQTEMARQAQQQQRLQMPLPQRMPAEKTVVQAFATQPQTTGRKDQNVPTQSSKASQAPRDPPHSMHAPYALTQVAPQPHVQTGPQMHPYQAYPTSSVAAYHSNPVRPEHGDRVVRTPSNQDQAGMVDEHFRRCLLDSTVPRSHSQSTTVSTTSSTDSERYNELQKQEQLSSTAQHPVLNPQATKPVLNFPGVYGMHVMRHPTMPAEHQMWTRPAANFRPPIPAVPSQQPSYLAAQAAANFGVHSGSAEQQIRMELLPQESHSSLPQSLKSQPSSEPNDQVMNLFQRYPVIWQGLLALKNDSAAVQTHFICGDKGLAEACLPRPDTQSETDKERNLAVLRIVQRMRLDPSQLEGIDKRMMDNSDFCLLLALPCGRDEDDVIKQQDALKEGFIDYLKQKQAAGIVNIQHQQTRNQVQYVLHVFPPCEFTTRHLQLHAQDLLSNINDIQHIMIVIAAV